MRLLFINPGEGRHGSTYRARALSRLLRDCGHRVIYVESNSREDGARVISTKQADTPLGYVLSSLDRSMLCLKRDYDILYLQKAWPLTLPSLIIAKLRKKKVIIDFDDLDSEWQRTPFRRRIMRFTEKWMPHWADAVTTHNPYLQQFIQESTGTAAHIIPQGVDSSVFDPLRYDRSAERRRLGLDDRVVLCFLGSFTVGSSRDLSFILQALRLVQERHNRVTFLIIGGEGPLEDEYLQLIRTLGLEDVRITGRVPQNEVPRNLAACDAGLIFMDENRANRMRMSFKLIEYLSMELPVVGYVTGSSRDIFGEYCFLCPPSVEGLADEMLRVLKGCLKKDSARSLIVRSFDWKAVGNTMRELLGSE